MLLWLKRLADERLRERVLKPPAGTIDIQEQLGLGYKKVLCGRPMALTVIEILNAKSSAKTRKPSDGGGPISKLP